jgi:PAS domain S-box-containing protein
MQHDARGSATSAATSIRKSPYASSSGHAEIRVVAPLPRVARDDQEPGDPYRREVTRRVRARLPLAFGVFLGSVALSALFEVVRFPERRWWMIAFAASFAALVAATWWVVRRRPEWTIAIMIGLVNVVGVEINAYHAIVEAPVAPCVWVLTALLCGVGVLLPWGRRNQALACVGVLLSYPVHLQLAGADPLAWAAGGVYLLAVSAMSAFGAALFARYVQKDLQLTAALSEREARLQSYFDLSLVGMAVVDAEGRCREVNGELCRMLGLSHGELAGLAWSRVVHVEDRATAGDVLARALAGAPGRVDLRCLRPDGVVIHATVAFRGLPGADGRIDRAMILVHDITERREAELERERSLARTEAARREAEQASRAKDAFLATVSHELRTPLTPILAWADLLHAGGLGSSRTARAVSAIQRNARAQARLIDDLLDMSRIVAGEWRFELRPVDVTAVLRAALDVVRPAADAKGVVLAVTIPPRAATVSADPERLQQVFWNLASNAIKFTPRGGCVYVAVKHRDADVEVSVQDTGEGIPREFLAEIFEPFRQADSTASRRHAGLGLGLAIVRALVERHGGRVQADSAGEGRGATFTVELPRLPDDALEEATARIEPAIQLGGGPRAALRGLRVLVVDDDPDSNTVVSTLLAARGADVQTALSASEALAIAARWRPDVVVSDIAMPGEDGIALLQELRRRRATIGEVPAIALTAYGSSADRRRLLDAGFRAHVAKPFDPVHLAAVVETAAFSSPSS